MSTWREINELEGYEVGCKNVTDGRIIWKVASEVDDDEFIAIREKYNALSRTNIIQCMIQKQHSRKIITCNHFRRSGRVIWTKMSKTFMQLLLMRIEQERTIIQDQ